jgi:hypothetical protein
MFGHDRYLPSGEQTQRQIRVRMKFISVFYSFLSARMGSMRAARKAGKTDAALAMKASGGTDSRIG